MAYQGSWNAPRSTQNFNYPSNQALPTHSPLGMMTSSSVADATAMPSKGKCFPVHMSPEASSTCQGLSEADCKPQSGICVWSPSGQKPISPSPVPVPVAPPVKPSGSWGQVVVWLLVVLLFVLLICSIFSGDEEVPEGLPDAVSQAFGY